MNRYYYELMAKEKIKGLMAEGMINQEVNRTKGPRTFFNRNFPLMVGTFFAILLILGQISP